MSNQTYKISREGYEAVTELVENCLDKNATQLAELEAQFTIMGLGKLANIVRTIGLGNAGDEYIAEYNQVLQAKF